MIFLAVAAAVFNVEGSSVTVRDTPQGVTITVTSADPAKAAAIQAAARSKRAAPPKIPGLHECPEGHYSGERTENGLCPVCGKSLQAKPQAAPAGGGPSPRAGLKPRAAEPAKARPHRCPKGHRVEAKPADGRCPVCGAWLQDARD